MKKFNKDMTIAEVLEENENLKEVLMGFGMHCFGCPCALAETLEEAAKGHGISLEKLLDDLNKAR